MNTVAGRGAPRYNAHHGLAAQSSDWFRYRRMGSWPARMEVLASYIPQDRCCALARGVDLPDRGQGAALFADVSGFTPLSEMLARTFGPRRGAEELTLHLNAVYDALIGEVDDHGGSVIAFAGDAITCWFDRDDGWRATACGLAMQAAMQRRAVVRMGDGREVTLAVKVSVATGPVRRFVAGDPAIRLMDVLAGQTLVRMAAAATATQRGEVVLDEATATELQDRIRVATTRTPEGGEARFVVVEGLSRPPEPVALAPASLLSDAVTRPWLIPAVADRLRAGLGEFLTELRPAVACFVKFDGIEYDEDDEAGRKLSRFVSWIQQLLEPYEGFLLDINVGDKGSYLYYAFGAPVAHEDDTRRALTVARRIREAPAHFPFIRLIQLGVNRGTMRTGAYGGSRRRTYGVLGDDVNLAARLMEKAVSGQVLVSGKVQADCPAEFTWEALPPLLAKGKTAPVNVFSLVDAAERRRGRVAAVTGSPMVGRRAELALIEDRLALAARGQGQLVGITAEAGMGKTRLIAEIAEIAEELEFATCAGECQAFGTNASYLVWQDVWRQFFEVDPRLPVVRQIESLEHRLAGYNPGLRLRVPLLGSVLNLAIPDNDLTRHFDAKLRKSSLESLLVECLRHEAAQRPVLFVLEDCHWLDPLSRDLLETLARSVASLPVLILLAYRPPESPGAVSPALHGLPHFAEIALVELPRSEAEELLRLRLGEMLGEGTTASAELRDRLLARAQGNPFYLEELLRYLQDQGMDWRDPSALDRFELPASLHSLILGRIDRLLESQKVTLKVASVLGRLFPAAALWGIRDSLPEAQVRADLLALSQAELTVEEQAEPELVYLFRHVVTQEVAYESLPFGTRSILHNEIGLYLERQGPDAVTRHLDLLAFHFDRSPNLEKRRQYLRQAGEAAQARYANRDAISYYERVLPLLEAPGQTDVRMRLGRVLELVGRWQDAADHYRGALESAVTRGDLRAQAAAETARGELYRKRSEYAEAERCLNRARALYTELKDEAGRADTLHYAGSVAAQQGQYDEACALYQRSLEIRRRLKDKPRIASLLSNLGIVAWCRGEINDARAYYDAALRLRQESGDRWAISVSLNNLGLAVRDLGDVTGARTMLEQALAISRLIGDRWSIANTLSSLGDVALSQGALEDARGFLVESLGIARELNDRQALAFLLEYFGVLVARRGRVDRGFQVVGAARALRDALGSPLSPSEQERLDHALREAQPGLPPAASETWLAEGKGLGLEAAIELALRDSVAAREPGA